jgi:DNA invertase Pin-like site-specific DNA recombinase
MARVYSYLRFSDPRQALGGSADRQQAYAERWAAEHGLVLDESLSLRDEGLSAFHQRHVKAGALGAFLQAVNEGMIEPGSVLVVEGLDRLSRAEPLLAQSQLAQIVNAGISVVTASDGRTYSRETLKANPMDLIYSLLVMIRAHEESDTKSKRVSAAITRLAEQWQAGTYRGRVQIGHDPAWVNWTGTAFKLVEERAAAVREMARLFSLGLGNAGIRAKLVEAGLRDPANKAIVQANRLVRNRILIGTKVFELGGREWALQGYYPPLLTMAEWDDLQQSVTSRARSQVKSMFVELLSGMGLTYCGYCGSAMVAQNQTKRMADPTAQVPDAYRRLRCSKRLKAALRGDHCPIGGSAALRPIEVAIMAYCSDMLNLRSLQISDRAKAPRETLAKARTELTATEAKLAKLLDAMLESDKPPKSWVERTHTLEAQIDQLRATVASSESELAIASRTISGTQHEQFAALSAGVAAMQDEPRLKARKLITDTFERLVVWHRGMQPETTEPDPKWKLRRAQNREHVDVLLMGKNGTTRLLRIDQHGAWVAADDITELPA